MSRGFKGYPDLRAGVTSGGRQIVEDALGVITDEPRCEGHDPRQLRFRRLQGIACGSVDKRELQVAGGLFGDMAMTLRSGLSAA